MGLLSFQSEFLPFLFFAIELKHIWSFLLFHLISLNFNFTRFERFGAPNNLFYVSDKFIGCVAGSGHRILARDSNNWAIAQPLVCIEGEPNVEGEFALAQWNQDAFSSSSNATSRIVNDVILFKGVGNVITSSPEIESRSKEKK